MLRHTQDIGRGELAHERAWALPAVKDDNDLPGTGCRYGLCAQARRRIWPGIGGRGVWRSRRGPRGRGARASRKVRDGCSRAAQRERRSPWHAVQGRRRDHAAWLARGLSGLGTGRLERACRPSAMGRAGSAAGGERRLHRDVEFGGDGLRPRPAAHHGRRRCARDARQRGAQACLSAEARLRRMDGHHAAHGAAGGLRCGRPAHARRADRRWQLPHRRPEDLHYLRRARPHREHHSFRAGASA